MKRVFLKTREELASEFGEDFAEMSPGVVGGMMRFLGEEMTSRIDMARCDDILEAQAIPMTMENSRDFPCLSFNHYSWNYHWFRVEDSSIQQDLEGYKIKQNGLFSI